MSKIKLQHFRVCEDLQGLGQGISNLYFLSLQDVHLHEKIKNILA